MTKPRESDPVAEAKHNYDSYFSTIDCAHVSKSIMYISIHKKNAHPHVVPQQNTQPPQNAGCKREKN